MTVDDLWRKNRRDNPGTPCDGVDLNRNLDLLWGVTEGQTSCSPCSDVFCGPSAFSEPETRNVKYLLDSHRIHCFVDVHSFSELDPLPVGARADPDDGPVPALHRAAERHLRDDRRAGYEEYMHPQDLHRFQTVGARIVDAIRRCAGGSTRASPASRSTRRPAPTATTSTAGTSPTRACARPTATRSRPARTSATPATRSIRPTRRRSSGRQVGNARAGAAVRLRDRADRHPAARRDTEVCLRRRAGRPARHDGGGSRMDRAVRARSGATDPRSRWATSDLPPRRPRCSSARPRSSATRSSR